MSASWEHVVVLEKDFASLFCELACLTTQRTIDKTLLNGFRTAFALQKKASHQNPAVDAKDCEKLFAEKTSTDNELHKVREDMQEKL